MATSYKYIKDIRKRMKDFAVAAMGGSCQICAYDKCVPGLEFHHINADDKDFDFSQIKGWDSLCDELEKCIMLCCRCHREVHYGVAEVPLEFTRLNRDVISELREAHLKEAVKRPNRKPRVLNKS